MKPISRVILLCLLFVASPVLADKSPTNFVLVMSDDQGWGQVGYMDHPHLETPHLDAMAANGLRFHRFYAGASNCSPSRATVLTGRSNDRPGVYNHGFPLRLQEKTVAQALLDAGYATAHFGKWHLNGLRGPGAPILAEDSHHPVAFGFEHWVSVTNFFDRNPLLSRLGEFEEHEGDSSEIVVDEAVRFIADQAARGEAFFVVVWYGTPHDPMVASPEDRAPFSGLPDDYANQLGELVAMDRSIGALRAGLRAAGVANDTLVWFCSDNGGLGKYPARETMGGLRGAKNTMYEGGLRVPGLIEWPAVVEAGRVSGFPAGTVDIFPTLAEIAALPDDTRIQPQDGISLLPLLEGKEPEKRDKPLAFRHDGRGVLIDNAHKFLVLNGKTELYDLEADQSESRNLSRERPELHARMKKAWDAWNASVDASDAGKDYPGGTVDPDQPGRRFWWEDSAYADYLEEWSGRPEFKSRLRKFLDQNER